MRGERRQKSQKISNSGKENWGGWLKKIIFGWTGAHLWVTHFMFLFGAISRIAWKPPLRRVSQPIKNVLLFLVISNNQFLAISGNFEQIWFFHLTKKFQVTLFIYLLIFFLGGGWLNNQQQKINQLYRHFRQFWTTLIFFMTNNIFT